MGTEERSRSRGRIGLRNLCVEESLVILVLGLEMELCSLRNKVHDEIFGMQCHRYLHHMVEVMYNIRKLTFE